MAQNEIHQAFILCAGIGSRLRPYTLERPKPLVAVNGKSLLARTLEHLRATHIDKVVLNTHYLADQIKDAARDITAPHIILSHEEELLDTGGGIRKALHHFGGQGFFVLSGDGLWENADQQNTLMAMKAAWDPDKMDILMLLQPAQGMTLTKGVGDYDLAKNGQATRSLERTGDYMFTSIRINSARIFDDAPPDQAFSYLQLMDAAQEQGRLYGLVHEGNWHHISTPDDLQAVRDEYEERGA